MAVSGPAQTVLRYLRGCGDCLCGRLCGPCQSGDPALISSGTVERVLPEAVVLTDGRVLRRPAGAAPRPGERVAIDQAAGIVAQARTATPHGWASADDAPLIPRPTGDPSGPFLPAARVKRWTAEISDTQAVYVDLPSAVMVPDSRHFLRSLYPVETGAGFRNPLPVNQEFPLLESVPPITRFDLDVQPRVNYPHLDHYALRQRDPLLAPYATGIKDGRRYVRIYDVPLGDIPFFLRNGGAPLLPDDGVSLWAKPTREWADFWRNDPQLTVMLSKPVAGTPIRISGQHAYITGDGGGQYYLYRTDTSTTQIGSGTFRELHRASLSSATAGVKRLYEDGSEEAEVGVAALDLLLRPVPTPSTSYEARFAAFNDFLGYVTSDSYTTGAQASIGNSGDDVGLSLGGAFGGASGDLYYNLLSSDTSFPQPARPKDAGLGASVAYLAGGEGGSFGPQLAYSVPVNSAGPDSGAVAPAPQLARQGVMRRYRDQGGDPALWEEGPYVLTEGRVVYEGPLGILPAPRSGRVETWCGLSVNGQQHFSADAWTEKGVRFAAVLYEDGSLHVSQQPLASGKTTLWEGGATDAGLPSLDSEFFVGGFGNRDKFRIQPQLSYSFLLPGWPFEGGGCLMWGAANDSGGTRAIRAVSKQQGGGRLAPVALAMDSLQASQGNPEIRNGSVVHRANTTTPISRTSLPSAVMLDGKSAPQLLAGFRRAAPGEANPERIKAPSISGLLEIAFAVDWAFPVGETLPTAPLVVDFLIPARQATEAILDSLMPTPDGWTREIGFAAPGHTFTLLHFAQTIGNEQPTFQAQVRGLKLACPRALVGSIYRPGGP